MNTTQLTVVIPTYNEQDSLVELHRQITAAATAINYRARMIFVDDGSTDESWKRITELAADDPNVFGVRFRRNFGKAAALSAGFELAEDPFVVTMDADLQDDPAELPLMFAKLDQGYDVVSGWKIDRQDPWHKTIPSLFFNKLVGWMTGVRLHDHNCGFKLYRREVLNEIRLYGELHRFVPVLAASRGFRVTEAPVNHRARKHGKSKYGISRIVKGLLDLFTVKFITGFGQRPQHLLGATGLLAFVAGLAMLAYLAVAWCATRMVEGWDNLHVHQTALLYYALASFLIGGQFLSIGLLGEMLTSFLIRKNDLYSIAEYSSPKTTNTTESAAETVKEDA